MDQDSQRNLKILTEIAQSASVTQRGLSKNLGMALGLTNMYLKRLVHKGYIKITTIPPNRLRYLLTPKGIAQKTRLTYEYMSFSLVLYRETRESLREALESALRSDLKKVALYGTGEAAELAYLTLRELGLEPVGIFASAEKNFLGLPVCSPGLLLDAEVDRVIVASFEPMDGELTELIEMGLPREKLIFLGPEQR